MKKLVILLALAVVLLAGCGKANGNKENTTTEANKALEVSYTINEVKVVPGTDFAEAYAVLGEPKEFTEAASCYFDGNDKVFTYEGFEVRTYPSGDKDFVLDICLQSDEYKTDKGITIGSSVEEVIAAYGEAYELTGKTYKYTYDNGKYIYFFTLNDVVKYFGYAYDAKN